MSTLFRRKGSRFVWIGFTDQWGLRHTRSTKIAFDVRAGRDVIPHTAREIQRRIDLEISMQIFGMMPRGKSPTVSQVLESYLASAGSNLRPNSVRCKRLAVRELVRFLGDVPVASISRDDLFEWKAAILKKDISPHTAREIQRRIDLEISMQIFGMVPRGKSPTVSQVLESYLGSAGSNLRPNSVRCKRIAVRELVRFLGDVPVASISRDDLFEWKAAILKKDISPHTAASWIREVSPLFRWAVDEGMIDRSPVARGFKMNPPVQPPEVFTDDEREAILNAAKNKPHLHHALWFLWETGFRVGEMTNLKWTRNATTSDYAGYLDFEGNTIWAWNEKERRYDAYPMKGVRVMLEGLPRVGEWVFTAPRGGRIDPVKFNRELKRICRALKIPPGRTVHSIRKSYCSRLIRQGVDFGTVHKLMRHRDPATTMRYYAQFQLSTLEDGQSKGNTGTTLPRQSPTEEPKTVESES